MKSFLKKMANVIFRPVRSEIRRVGDDVIGTLRQEVRRVDENNKAMDYLARLLTPNEPWTGWTMHPSAVLTVVSDIQINDRSMVVECGSGLSTLYAAKALASTNGHIIALEHDRAWAEHVRGKLKELKLDDHATVVHAALAEWTLGGNHYRWYEEAALQEALDGQPPVDLVVVDGPPESVGHHSRYPAVPALKAYFDDEYAVILDDIDRDMEKEVVEDWEREVAADFQNDYRQRGIAYGRQGSTYEV